MILDIIKYAFSHFYPRQSKTYDSKVYPSLEQMYPEWMDSVYLNGEYYICEEIEDEYIISQERSVQDYSFVREEDIHLYFCVQLINFSRNQTVDVQVFYNVPNSNSEESYIVSGVIFDKDYTNILLDTTVSFEDITKIKVLDGEEVIEKYVLYSDYQGKEYLKSIDGVYKISSEEFDKLRNQGLFPQRLDTTIKCISYRISEDEYGLRIKNFYPNRFSNGQEYAFVSGDVTGLVDLESDTLEITGFTEKPTSVDIILELEEYTGFSGYRVRVSFDNIKGNSYTEQTNILYLPME